jgi:hypothetical protein
VSLRKPSTSFSKRGAVLFASEHARDDGPPIAGRYADEGLAQARFRGRVGYERPAFGSRLQATLPEFPIEEAEIAGPVCRRKPRVEPTDAILRALHGG